MKRLVGYRRFHILVVPCLLLIFQSIAIGQTYVSRITGQVFGANRRPLADVYVELRSEVESVLQRTRTNGGGTFIFSNLTAGRFSIRVRPFGTDYEEQIQEVELVTSVGGRNVADVQYKDFYLRTRRDAKPTTSVTEVVFAQEIPDAAKKSFEKAIGEFEGNLPDAGILDLENAVKTFPDYFLALDRLGVELLKKQRYPEASAYFDRAVVVNPKSANSWYGLSFALYAQNQTPRSIEAAKKATALSPESVEMNLMLGVALRQGRNYIDAEKSLLKAKKISNGSSADVSWNLALLYVYNIKNSRLAADELENYLKIKPDHPDAVRIKKLISQFRNSA